MAVLCFRTGSKSPVLISRSCLQTVLCVLISFPLGFSVDEDLIRRAVRKMCVVSKRLLLLHPNAKVSLAVGTQLEVIVETTSFSPPAVVSRPEACKFNKK